VPAPSSGARERFDQTVLIAAPPAVVFDCFFSPDALQIWWRVVRSVTTAVPFGVYAVEWGLRRRARALTTETIELNGSGRNAAGPDACRQEDE
jgi:uncharacterized protein YndB with AHSA1/START domain